MKKIIFTLIVLAINSMTLGIATAKFAFIHYQSKDWMLFIIPLSLEIYFFIYIIKMIKKYSHKTNQ